MSMSKNKLFQIKKEKSPVIIDLKSLHPTFGLLICTLISENQGLEKSRSASNLRKLLGPANLDLFSVCHLDFFQIYSINLAFFLGGDLEKNPGLQDLKFF